MDPMTGFFRNGLCDADERDQGRHLVCALMTNTFLAFTKGRGNDLSTPLPQYGFPGLKEGDRWCLCVDRWREALAADAAPPVLLRATHEGTLDSVSLQDLMEYAADL